MEITAESLLLSLSVVMTLLASYLPRFSVWFDKLGEKEDGSNDNGTLKRLVMLGLLLFIAAAIFGSSCTSWGAMLGIDIACNQTGATSVITAFVWAIIANQGVYNISPEASYVRKAREIRLGQASPGVGKA